MSIFKTLSFLASFVFVAGLSFGQADTIKHPTIKVLPTTPIYDVVEEMPFFPACAEIADYANRKACADNAMMKYLRENIKYPTEAWANQISGMVLISFVVDEAGNLTDIAINSLRPRVGGGCDEAALSVVQQMAALPQRWVAGRQNGVAVRVRYNLPLRFHIK